MDTCQSCGAVKSARGHYCKEFAIDQIADILKRADRHGVSIDYVVRNAVSHAEAERTGSGGTVEELAVEILKARELPAELWNSGGGIMLARVDGEYGVYALVSETEIDNDGEPFSVGVYAQPDDEPDLIRCNAEQLPDVVRNHLTLLEATVE